jgi:uncharacterized membrane protein
LDWLQIALRIVHIGAGVFWVGSAFFFFTFIEPTTAAIGPDSQKFMHHLVTRRRIIQVITTAATLTVAAGAVLYWRASGGLDLAWITRPTGLTFTLAGAVGLVSWLMAIFGIGPSVDQMDKLGAAMATAGRPPTSDEMARFQVLQGRLHGFGIADVAMLGFVVLAMSVARYLSF